MEEDTENTQGAWFVDVQFKSQEVKTTFPSGQRCTSQRTDSARVKESLLRCDLAHKKEKVWFRTCRESLSASALLFADSEKSWRNALAPAVAVSSATCFLRPWLGG